MKKGLDFSRDPDTKENQKILKNFYIREMKKGKTIRASTIDNIVLDIGVFLLCFLFFNQVIGRIILALLLSVLTSTSMGIYMKRAKNKLRDKKIEEFKKGYESKLREEKLLLEDDDLEKYLINRYYDKKEEFKTNLNFFSKDKIFKYYLLSIVFYIISYFVTYPIYYRIMAILSFILATIIGSYNLTEYIRNKDLNSLLNRDIDV